MKSVFIPASVALMLSTSASFAAGDSQTAMDIAIANEACGENSNDLILSARFLDDGRVGVRCARGAAIFGGGSGAAGGGVATNFVPIVGGLLAVTLGAAALAGSSDGGSVPSTPSTN